MADRRVICIIKPDRTSSVDRIQELQGDTVSVFDNWWATPVGVAEDIIAERHRYFTESGGRRTFIHWREGQNGKYVQTHANEQWNDNLLSLPECQRSYRPQ